MITPRTGPTGVSVDLPTPASALAIVAHPDDAEFQVGATLARWARVGCTIYHLVLTDGSKGTWDPTVDQAELVRRRRDEQLGAARLLGGGGVGWLAPAVGAVFWGDIVGSVVILLVWGALASRRGR
ncbi:MAG: PIG-L deacetylase family protein [Alphaproteobacteria bacterium]